MLEGGCQVGKQAGKEGRRDPAWRDSGEHKQSRVEWHWRPLWNAIKRNGMGTKAKNTKKKKNTKQQHHQVAVLDAIVRGRTGGETR